MEPAADPRRRRWLAAGVAVVGTVALAAGLTWGPRSTSTSKPSRGSGSATNQGGVIEPGRAGRPPSNGPGGVGPAPERTGLPAIPAPGGKVRTGSKDQGCFASVREYIDQWDRTGVEPDPCFTTQPPSEQPQPDQVKRTYNGERF
jgi:hypothetical protein